MQFSNHGNGARQYKTNDLLKVFKTQFINYDFLIIGQVRQNKNVENNKHHINKTQHWRSVTDNSQIKQISELTKMTQKFEKDVSLQSAVEDNANNVKALFDPSNPTKMIIVKDNSNTRPKNYDDNFFFESCTNQNISSAKSKGIIN